VKNVSHKIAEGSMVLGQQAGKSSALNSECTLLFFKFSDQIIWITVV